MADSAKTMKLLLLGDVMIGRGVDQILEHPLDPKLVERTLTNAQVYVTLAEKKHGPLPPPEERFANPGAYVWGAALPAIHHEAPHASLVNLETAVTTYDQHDLGKPFLHRCHPLNISNVLRQAVRIDGAIIANNHTGDYNLPGQLETHFALRAHGITPIGVGMNLEEAHSAQMIHPDVAVVALAPETGHTPVHWRAGVDSPGMALSFDELGPKDVAHVRTQFAKVSSGRATAPIRILAIHSCNNWGVDVKDRDRKFANQVTDPKYPHAHVIIDSSSHHPKGFEVTKNGSLLVWGAGDFINDYEGTWPHPGFLKDVGLAYFPEFQMVKGDWQLKKLRLRPYQRKRMTLVTPDPDMLKATLLVLQRHSAVLDPKQSLNWVVTNDEYGPLFDVTVNRPKAKACRGPSCF